MTGPVTIRPATAEDDALLFQLFAEARQLHLSSPGMPVDALASLVAMQFRGRAATYSQRFPEATQWVVEVDGEAAGQVLLDETEDTLRIVDITVTPARRNSGAGTAVLQRVQALAASGMKSVALSVVASSPATRLYCRLGFGRVATDGVHDEMLWAAPSAQPLP